MRTPEHDSRPYAVGERLALLDEELRTAAILEIDDVRATDAEEPGLTRVTFHVVGQESTCGD